MCPRIWKNQARAGVRVELYWDSRALLESGQDPCSCQGPRKPVVATGRAVTCYQVHGVHLDGVLLGVPLSGHGNGQGLAGDSEELAWASSASCGPG